MDFGSDDGSDTERWDSLSVSPLRFPVDLGKAYSSEGYPSSVNILKPQIDKIFSEVQKNLPTIDFDSSDISSDNDEPIFFHHSLKLGDISSRFDDDKDLDTSMSGPDHSSSPLGLQTTTRPFNNSLTYPSSSLSKTLFTTDDELLDTDTQTPPYYDNDLAALLSQAQYPSPEEVGKWRSLAQKMEDDEATDFRLENLDLERSVALGHFSQTHDQGVGTSDIHFSLKTDSSTSTSFIVDELRDVPFDEDHIIDKFNDRLQEGMKNLDRKERHRLSLQQARSKDEEIVSKFTLEEPTTLNMRLFEEIDLDSVLHQANEESIPLTSLRIVGNPSANQIPTPHVGAGDGTSQSDGKEELTLIQKLAQLSMAQSGSALAQSLREVNSNFDPHTGAIVKRLKPDPKIKSSPRIPQHQPHPHVETEIRHTASKAIGTSSTCSAGTSTSNSTGASGAGKILYGRPRLEKRDVEPATVFIDLRGFEQQKEEEKMGLQSVQRVLGLSGAQQEEESSSDDDEEMVERCNWRQTRQKLKEDLSTLGASATLQGVGTAGGGKAGKSGYKKPPRVINLQENSISRKWSSTQSDNRSQNRSGVEGQESEVGEEAVPGVPEAEVTEEDNKEIMARQEAEREQQRQREEARKLREAREKEREARIRMSKHVEAAQSTASTQGKQDAAENTPPVFDFEASYEPSPSTLPTILSPDRETVLLTIQLSSNGEIVQHRSKGHRSVDTGEGLSATYTALLSWLLSLVPHDFTFLEKSSSSSSSTTTTSSSSSHPNTNTNAAACGFHVIGLQQMWYEEQLRLCVAVTPSQQFLEEGPSRHSRSKRSKQRYEEKNSSLFFQHLTKFLTVNTLYTVCPWLETLVSVPVQSQRTEDKGAASYCYEPPLPKISTKPLNTYVQVNQVSQAARDLFNVPVGVFWQTVDNDEASHSLECHDKDVCFETQNTMSLVYKKIFHNPLSLMAILNRVSQEGLDLAGVRLIYPCQGLVELSSPSTTSSSSSSSSSSQQKEQQQQQQKQQHSEMELVNSIGPIFAMALRGTFARSIWLESVGPSDPQLARRTDPNSLCALYGGDSRDSALLFCPRNPSRVQSELARWFGGHIAPGTMSVDVGIPYRPKDEVKVTPKKGKRQNKSSSSDQVEVAPHRPPAALTATSKSDVFIMVSPLVPPSYLGILMATGQRRGYQVRGVRRIQLTAKLYSSLGIPPVQSRYFCPGARTEDIDVDHPVDAISPTTVLLLRKENSAHNAASLIEAFMVQMTLAGLLGCVQMRVREPLNSKHLFHASTYSDGLMALMGGSFGKTPEFDLTHLSLSSSTSPTVRKDLEQVAVILILGHDALKKSGLCVGKILNVLPYSKTPLQPVLSDRLELLGIKWVASLSIYQAKELTPFEVGDYRWRPSVKMLESEPALVLVVRGVNIFQSLKPLLEEQEKLDSGGRGLHHLSSSSSATNKGVKKISYLMSHNPSQSEVFARLFFTHRDLYPDPLARSLLPYMPEFRLYFNVLEHTRENRKVKRVFSLKPLEELNLTLENVFKEMKQGQQPITTCLLVKPMAVKKHLAKILRRIAQEGFKVVGMRMMMLDGKSALDFIPACSMKAEKEESHVLEKHVESLTSGPSLALALQQHNAIKRLSDLIGPEEPMTARRHSQFLWRGEFGSDIYNNAFYSSSYYVDAVRDIKTFFPDGLCCEDTAVLQYEQIHAPSEDSTISLQPIRNAQLSKETTTQGKTSSALEDVHSLLLQTNCLILTPPLMKWKSHSQHSAASVDVINTLISMGFEPVALRLLWLTQKQAECLLAHLGSGSFQQVSMLCRGPCLILAVERDNAVLSFDSILQHTSQSSKMMEEYGNMIFRGTTVKQSHSLLTFFFDQLMPGSQLTISNTT